MPTQEERLSTLEQSIGALNRVLSDINHNETMLLGMAVKQGEISREMRASLAVLNERFEDQTRQLTDQGKQLANQGEQLTDQGKQLANQGEQLADQGKKLDQILQVLTTLTNRPNQQQ